MTGSRRREPADQPTRRQRRAQAREERSEKRPARRRAAEPTPLWRSPMVLLTGAALAIGLAVIGFAVLSRPAATIDDLVPPLSSAPASLADGRTLGSPTAPVTVEIWSDFQCPGCRQLAQRAEPALIEQYVVPGVARLVYRDAAFQGARVGGPYDESVEAAAGARCAAEQNKFWVMHDWIFANWNGENEGAFRAERLRAIAAEAGVDIAAWDACMATGEQQQAARDETSTGVAAGVHVTPSLFINGQLYPGGLSLAEIAAAIEAAADAVASPSP
jgi:protein-disulfide isomerase